MDSTGDRRVEAMDSTGDRRGTVEAASAWMIGCVVPFFTIFGVAYW